MLTDRLLASAKKVVGTVKRAGQRVGNCPTTVNLTGKPMTITVPHGSFIISVDLFKDLGHYTKQGHSVAVAKSPGGPYGDLVKGLEHLGVNMSLHVYRAPMEGETGLVSWDEMMGQGKDQGKDEESAV